MGAIGQIDAGQGPKMELVPEQLRSSVVIFLFHACPSISPVFLTHHSIVNLASGDKPANSLNEGEGIQEGCSQQHPCLRMGCAQSPISANAKSAHRATTTNITLAAYSNA